MEKIRAVKKKYEPAWLKIPGVVSVGIGMLADGKPGIRIGASVDVASLQKKLPPEVEGVALEVFFCGPIDACR